MGTPTINTLEKITALCKRKGFVFQSAEIYGSINGIYDLGPMGVLLKEELRKLWKKSLQNKKGETLFIEGSLINPKAVWDATGHTENFYDSMVDCMKCKHRYRTDHIDTAKACSNCGNIAWTKPRNFNMMFQTNLGAAEDISHIAYLRPETAQSIFVNFKQIMTSSRAKIPFGIAQIGKAFRNEITPKQFLFRMREFEQMELEWFCKEENTQEFFDFWIKKRLEFYALIGIKKENIRIQPHAQDALAHYAKQTHDVEYQFPFGWKELEGIANRGDFDLSCHTKNSGKDLSVYDDVTKQSFMPNVIECSVGVDRLLLAVLFDAYTEDIINNEQRILLSLHPSIAPIKAAILPLSKKLSEQAHAIYQDIQKETSYTLQFDDAGSIGKRYRRQDEIGTPFCFTYDFESCNDQKVTIRYRDTAEQKRISISSISAFLKKEIAI